jgi:hypothetical protein
MSADALFISSWERQRSWNPHRIITSCNSGIEPLRGFCQLPFKPDRFGE